MKVSVVVLVCVLLTVQSIKTKGTGDGPNKCIKIVLDKGKDVTSFLVGDVLITAANKAKEEIKEKLKPEYKCGQNGVYNGIQNGTCRTLLTQIYKFVPRDINRGGISNSEKQSLKKFGERLQQFQRECKDVKAITFF